MADSDLDCPQETVSTINRLQAWWGRRKRKREPESKIETSEKRVNTSDENRQTSLKTRADVLFQTTHNISDEDSQTSLIARAHGLFQTTHNWQGNEKYFKNMICYAIFSAIGPERLDVFVLGMEAYQEKTQEYDYLEWFVRMYDVLRISRPRVLDIQTYFDLMVEDSDFVEDFKDFIEGR